MDLIQLQDLKAVPLVIGPVRLIGLCLEVWSSQLILSAVSTEGQLAEHGDRALSIRLHVELPAADGGADRLVLKARAIHCLGGQPDRLIVHFDSTDGRVPNRAELHSGSTASRLY